MNDSTVSSFITDLMTNKPQTTSGFKRSTGEDAPILRQKVPNQAITNAYWHAHRMYYAPESTCTVYDASMAGLKSQGLSVCQPLPDGRVDWRLMVKIADIVKMKLVFPERELARIR